MPAHVVGCCTPKRKQQAQALGWGVVVDHFFSGAFCGAPRCLDSKSKKIR